MINSLIQSPTAVTLIGGGAVTRGSLDLAMAIAPVLVAADGGADHALAEGRHPTCVIGDMDSISDSARATLGPARINHITEQSSTDFEKCLTHIAAPFILALGFSGPRLDHTLAVCNALVTHSARPCLVLSDVDLMFAAPAGKMLHLALPAGTRVSLFPMAKVRGISTGLRWKIDPLTFAPDGQIGTSNEALGPVAMEFASPGMLVILPRKCLDAAIASLGL